MRKLRVLVMMHKDLVPPDDVTGLPYEAVQDFKTEFDVLAALEVLGHDVQGVGLDGDLDVLRSALLEFRPHIVFNVIEEFLDVSTYAQRLISYLELRKQAYTGCNPRGILIAHDKPLAKQVLAHHGIPTPGFHVFPIGAKVARPAHLEYPLFVKSAYEDASVGITQRSVVRTDKQLADRVANMHEAHDSDAIVEEYVDGRELYLGVIGNERLTTLPIWEMKFQKWSKTEPRIATRRVKWDPKYQDARGIRTRTAKLAPAVEREVQRICKQAYRALGITGYARFDLRLDDAGRPHIIEANPNPDIAVDEDFARSAKAGGIEYEELIERFLKLGLAYVPEWKRIEMDR